MTTYFKKLKIMPVDMLFKYSILKMLLKTLNPEKLEEFSKSHNYNTRSTKLKPIKTNNNRGGRSLLCSGIELYNRYLLGWEVASLPVAMAGLAGRLRAGVQASFKMHPSPPSRGAMRSRGKLEPCSLHTSLQLAIWLSFTFFFTLKLFFFQINSSVY